MKDDFKQKVMLLEYNRIPANKIDNQHRIIATYIGILPIRNEVNEYHILYNGTKFSNKTLKMLYPKCTIVKIKTKKGDILNYTGRINENNY